MTYVHGRGFGLKSAGDIDGSLHMSRLHDPCLRYYEERKPSKYASIVIGYWGCVGL